ncbi:hypothetical protein [Cloacibacillus porcorum]|uniref:Uncharacterized protein n=1 Tax=Cloacibacillus porcorum TaxID=1197717 RepID=A0A1B2I665_9BACT|nr:hypothetical protein [Cloacibacillus porcorum]ANZ45437.1 hypothetical protein BED41_10390 [Cloacibacillus porcorum]
MTSKEKETAFKAFMIGTAVSLLSGVFTAPNTGFSVGTGLAVGWELGEVLWMHREGCFIRCAGGIAGAALGTLILWTAL